LLLEGLAWFRNRSIKAYFLCDNTQDEPIPFEGRYRPQVVNLEQPGDARRGAIRRRLARLFRLRKVLQEHETTHVLANCQIVAMYLLVSGLLAGKMRPFACFIHGSFFQFSDSWFEKYALIHRRHFRQIWESQEVYRQEIPLKCPRMPIARRFLLEVKAFVEWVAVRQAKAIFVLTENAAKEARLLYGHRNVVVAQGAFPRRHFDYRAVKDLRRERIGGGKVAILSLCRLVAKKRVALLIRAFSLFAQKRPESVLLIAGTGPDRDNLVQLAQSLGVSSKVQFLGYVKENELNDWYCAADMVATADNAFYDIVPLVALALGRTVVSSEQHEWDPGLVESGMVLQCQPTPEGFAGGFERALSRRPLPSKEQRRTLLAKYTWESYFPAILDQLTS
jgi:glycosyltransferase involved in cell wall biosynthesis